MMKNEGKEGIEPWAATAAKMKNLGVDLPPEEQLVNPTFGDPSLFVASRLMGDTDKQKYPYGVSTSYLNPQIEHDASPSQQEFNIEFPEPVLRIARTVQMLGGRAVLVGECIRDLLYDQIADTNTETKDFDLEVYGLDFETLDKALHRIFPDSKMNTDGKSFGVTKVYAGLAEPIDVAIAREDLPTGQGHQDFESIMSPRMTYRHGSRRRDLRFNSAMYDPLRKTLYDPFLGVVDLQKKEINVTDPETFVEDPLRVLRIMQFAARFEMTPTDATKEFCTRMVQEGKLNKLSAERIRGELIKLLMKSKRPSVGLQFAREIGFVERAWPELHSLIGVQQHQEFHKEGDVWNHTLQTIDAAALITKREQLDDANKLTLLLTLLCHDMGKPSTTELIEGIYRAFGHEAAGVEPAQTFLKRLRFPNDTQKDVLALVPKHMSIPELYKQEHPAKATVAPVSADTGLKRLHRKLHDKTGMSLYMLMLVTEADHKGRNGESSTPLTDEELPEIVELRQWFYTKVTELELNKKPQKQLLDNKAFMAHLGEKKGGPWLGVITMSVLLDQEENLVTTPEEAFTRAQYYFAQLQHFIDPAERVTSNTHDRLWERMLRDDDPRERLQQPA